MFEPYMNFAPEILKNKMFVTICRISVNIKPINFSFTPKVAGMKLQRGYFLS